MLKIRLRRMGAPHKPFFRVVVSDSRKATTASAVEEIGFYDPRPEPPVLQVDRARIDHWVGNGAQMSATLKRLIKSEDKGWPVKEKKAKAAPVDAPEPAPAESTEEEAVQEAAAAAEATDSAEAAETGEPAAAESAATEATDEAPAEAAEVEAEAEPAETAEPEAPAVDEAAADDAAQDEADSKASTE